MLDLNEIKAIGVASGLIILNIGLMWFLSHTPVSLLLGFAFSIPILGIIVYGAMLTGGNYLAHRGVKREDFGLAILGMALLQFAYGSFGAGLLYFLDPLYQAVVLGITAVVVTLIAITSAAVVYGTKRDFSSWNMYATYFFIGVLVFGAIGSIFPPVLVIAFISALLGFIAYLVYEIWDMRTSPEKIYLNGIGIYVAFMGVFIQVLQIIIRLLSRR